MFISYHYAAKSWTNHERQSALAGQLLSSEQRVLPARFDDTELPGLLPTIGYVDLRVTDPESLVVMILSKLGQWRGA
jgi:hypothetical protein